MRRPLLLTLIAVGSLVVLIGGTGLFAALTDTARTGTNQVDSAPLAASADIQLATATYAGGAIACGTFSENLETAFFTQSNVTPGYLSGIVFFCIRNVGSQAVNIWASVDELVDTDLDCTGDEALHGDTTCGGNLLGELSTVLWVGYTRATDCSSTAGGGFTKTLKDNETNPGAFAGTLAAGATSCFYLNIEYKSTPTNSEINIQKAQSDQVTWRFKFRADAV